MTLFSIPGKHQTALLRKRRVLNVGCGVLVCLLALSFCFCGPGGSSRDMRERKVASNKWVTQRPVEIKIPENSDAKADLTRNFYFIMDGSGSMGERTSRNCGGDQQFRDKMEGARWAIKKFLEQVPQDVDIGLYVFDSRGKREVVPLAGDNREAFINAVEQISEGGGTPLAEAIRIGTDRLVDKYRRQLGYGEYRLVVVTDGKAGGIPDAALYAAKFGIPIYTIGLCVGTDHPLREFSVSYRAADNFADLSQGLQDTLAEIPSLDATDFQGLPQQNQQNNDANENDSK